jgi:hypothetical protein
LRLSLRSIAVAALLAIGLMGSPVFASTAGDPTITMPSAVSAFDCAVPVQRSVMVFAQAETNCDPAILAVADVCLSVVPTNAPALVPSPNFFGAGHVCQPFTDRSPPD